MWYRITPAYTHFSYRPLICTVPLPLVGSLLVWWWGDTPTLRVHPAVNMVGYIASWDPTHGTHRHCQLLASLQHLHQQKIRLRSAA